MFDTYVHIYHNTNRADILSKRQGGGGGAYNRPTWDTQYPGNQPSTNQQGNVSARRGVPTRSGVPTSARRRDNAVKQASKSPRRQAPDLGDVRAPSQPREYNARVRMGRRGSLDQLGDDRSSFSAPGLDGSLSMPLNLKGPDVALAPPRRPMRLESPRGSRVNFDYNKQNAPTVDSNAREMAKQAREMGQQAREIGKKAQEIGKQAHEASRQQSEVFQRERSTLVSNMGDLRTALDQEAQSRYACMCVCVCVGMSMCLSMCELVHTSSIINMRTHTHTHTHTHRKILENRLLGMNQQNKSLAFAYEQKMSDSAAKLQQLQMSGSMMQQSTFKALKDQVCIL
jgi:hypothetical protein